MCGIFGGIARHKFPEKRQIFSALEKLSHRGPDASGVEIKPPVFLSHRRLSIIDVDSRSNQPMKVGPLIICFNGEIYNFKTLRNQLELRGVDFKTQSDTEVIAQLFLLDGVECLNQFEGMFAFAIWDERTSKLTLARDKFGEKPVYYFQDKSNFCFASEIPAIESLIGMDTLKVDTEAINQYFQLTYIPAPKSPYLNMFQIMPGSFLQFDLSSWKAQIFNYYKPQINIRNWSKNEAIESLQYLLSNSVSLRATTADVPVATFLSGGVDSSIVTALASNAISGGVRAYSIGFPEEPSFDESPYARMVAKHLPGIKHEVVGVTESQLLDFTFKSLNKLGEPYADSSLIPTAYLCSQIDEKVVLGGDAADELFAGYGVYSAMRMSNRIPDSVKSLLLRIPKHTNPSSIRQPQLRALALFHNHLRISPIEEYISWRSYSNQKNLKKIGLTGSMKIIEDVEKFKLDSLAEILKEDIRFNLPNDMLKKVDLASMQFSKEVRLPFLDSALVEFALSLPENFLIGSGERKHLLRAAYRGSLPEEIFNRRKQGFLLPVRDWFKKGVIRDHLMDIARHSSDLDFSGIEGLMLEHSSGDFDHSSLLWSVLVYLVWKGRSFE
jgi:asparagine synthase (glutamine-hydrolysing)